MERHKEREERVGEAGDVVSACQGRTGCRGRRCPAPGASGVGRSGTWPHTRTDLVSESESGDRSGQGET